MEAQTQVFNVGLRDRVLVDPDRMWSEFLDAHGETLRRVIRRYHLGREDQEEVFQEVNNTLVKNDYRTLASWDPEACSLVHYLTIIANRTAINFVKSRFHQEGQRTDGPHTTEKATSWLIETLEDPTCSARERLQRLQVIQGLKVALTRLVESEKIRETDWHLVALRLRGLTYQEIEGLVGLPKATVVTRLSRLKPVLREELIRSGIGLTDLPS
jgi:RNA polymerase sigma factor (sigma-70 family)